MVNRMAGVEIDIPTTETLQSGMPSDAARAVEAVYRSDWGRIVATLIGLVGDKLRGIAVHIGARVAAKAEAGEILVSQTVQSLIAGAPIELEDRGEHELKGVPGAWRLFAVR